MYYERCVIERLFLAQGADLREALERMETCASEERSTEQLRCDYTSLTPHTHTHTHTHTCTHTHTHTHTHSDTGGSLTVASFS